MRKSSRKRVFATLFCILMLGSMLVFFAACGGSSTPASPSTPSTPSTPGGQKPGYYLLGTFRHEIQIWWPHQ